MDKEGQGTHSPYTHQPQMHHAWQAQKILILAALQTMTAAWALRRAGARAATAVQHRRAFRSTTVSMRAEPPPPRLDLVFDINKTIVLEDPAGGKDVRALLNEVISELAWGHVIDDGDGVCRTWTSAALPLSIDPPPLEKQPPPPPLVSYSSFIHKQHPDIAGGDLKAAKAIRDSLKGTFAEPDAPGQAYAHEVAALDAALRLPNPGNLDPGLMAAAGLAGRDRVLLLPAFLHFLLRLQADYSPRRFALQLRTFGDDLPRVAREFNALCAGQHPLFPGQCFGGGGGVGGPLVDHSLDLEGDSDCFGSMYRDAQGSVLVLGTFDGPSSRADLARYQQQGHRVLGSMQEIHAFVRQKQASARPTLAVRDYWPWWRENLEDGSAGKLVMVDEEALTIVLDDNIEKKCSHIVDLRFARTGSPVPFAEGVARGHLVRAEPFLALTQPQTYFWSSVLESVAKWTATTGNGGLREGRKGAGPPPPAAGG